MTSVFLVVDRYSAESSRQNAAQSPKEKITQDITPLNGLNCFCGSYLDCPNPNILLVYPIY